jgi:hypothetical protein
MVAPSSRRSRVSTASCLVPSRGLRAAPGTRVGARPLSAAFRASSVASRPSRASQAATVAVAASRRPVRGCPAAASGATSTSARAASFSASSASRCRSSSCSASASVSSWWGSVPMSLAFSGPTPIARKPSAVMRSATQAPSPPCRQPRSRCSACAGTSSSSRFLSMLRNTAWRAAAGRPLGAAASSASCRLAWLRIMDWVSDSLVMVGLRSAPDHPGATSPSPAQRGHAKCCARTTVRSTPNQS